jgi:hypothetical protein
MATWILQVIPLFFFVGGFANFVSYRSLARRGSALVPFWRSRAIRLHRRFGWWVPVALVLGAIVVDIVRFGLDHPTVGQVNVWLVFLLPHQLGYFYAEGRLTRLPRIAFAATAAVGFATMMVLTNLNRVFAGISVYPKSLLGTDVDRITNTNPPTLMMLAIGVWSISVAMLLRPFVSRWLQRAKVWKPVIAVNGIIMTVFLWHMTAFLIAILLLWPLGLGQSGDTTTSWWLQRPVWEVVPAVFLVVLVRVFGSFERPPAG